MAKSITIEDIARQAGVSPSTVSRVLNGTKPVADDKRALVLAAIEQHRYSPSPVARGLVRGRSMTVGVIMQDISSPFFGKMVEGIEQALDSAAYQPMFASTHWRTQGDGNEAHSMELLIDRRVDGLIVLASQIPDEMLLAVASRIPLIVVARRVRGLEAQCLYTDNVGGAYRATRYLLGLGHTRIAHIAGPDGHPDARDRAEGYCRALTEAGVPIDNNLLVASAFTEQSGLEAIEELLMRGQRFTAVFAANDQCAYGAMLGLFNHGYSIPNDVSVVGYDDQLVSAFTLPPLTTVRQPSIEMGQAAAQALLRLLNNEEPQLPNIPTDLIIRKSVKHLRQTP